jgi:LuxR family maltose regulon positive regulatory protein
MLTAPLAAKLAPPPPRDDLVPRARLAALLATPARLTLVVAPAGFGKTTLLASLAKMKDEGERMNEGAQPSPFAWLTLDERDNDPTRFWGYVAAALDTVAPGVGDHARSMLQSPAPPPVEVVVAALADELAHVPGAHTLVLDDYHLIRAEAIHASFAAFVDSLPPDVRVVVAGRAEPPLPLARWRLRGQLAEVRAADLRFTAEEAAELLARAGLSLPDALAAALAARTEGWAGALVLAARSLRGSPDPEGRIAAFAGSHRHLFDYLADEVLRRQPPAIQRFLLDTSILDQLSEGLCDAVRADEGSQETLERIEAEGLFLLPLDEERRWFRYHALFAEFLRERLRREEPDRPPLLHRRAAAWYDAHGLPAEAVAHLLAAGDSEAAATVVVREGRPLLLRSEVATVLGWLAALPPELARTRPSLALVEAWARALAGQFEQVGPALRSVEAALAAYTGDPDAPAPFSAPYTPRNLASEALAVRATVAGLRRETAEAIELSRRALAALPADSVLVRGVVLLMLGTSAYLQGDLGTAGPALAEAAQAGQSGGMPIIAIFALRLLGELQARTGQLHRAARTYEDAIARGAALYPRRDGAAPRPVPVAGAAYVGLAFVRYEWDELDAAEALLRDGIRLGRQGANVEILLMGPVGLAKVQRARGDLAAARATIAEALAFARSTGVPRLANWIAAEQARLELCCGDVAAAAAWDQERRLDPADHLTYLEEIDFLALAQLRVAQGRPGEALRLLTRLRGLAEAQGRVASLVEIHALTALASRAAGDHGAAHTALARALALAAPEGYVRTFVDFGEPMRLEIGDWSAGVGGVEPVAQQEALASYANLLLAAFPAADARPADPHAPTPARPRAPRAPVPPLVEPPSPRELEVLRWINEGLTNEQIAEKLVVGLSTVKKHINNLYAKLEVASRTQALKRARELGLVE